MEGGWRWAQRVAEMETGAHDKVKPPSAKRSRGEKNLGKQMNDVKALDLDVNLKSQQTRRGEDPPERARAGAASGIG